jgi:hypothetical protein
MDKRTRVLAALAAVAAVLIPGAARADAGIPMIVFFMPPMALALAPIAAIEGTILMKRLGLEWWRSLGASAAANAVSTLLGVPVTWAVLVGIELATGGAGSWGPESVLLDNILAVTWRAPWLPPYEGSLYWMVPVAAMVLMVPFFFMSWKAEYWMVARLNRGVARGAVNAACFWANLASYAGLAILMPVWASNWS